MDIAIILTILLTVIFIGTPISFGLGFVAIVCILFFIDPVQLIHIGNVVFDQGTSVNQLVAPMFILMAELLVQGGAASNIFRVLTKWLKNLRGGLAISTTLACTVFAALCGSSPATAVSIGRISIFEMAKRKYSPDLAAGTVAAGGTLGIMIPPSMTLIIFGVTTETSIAKLFISGILPGLLISAMFVLYIVIVGMIWPAAVGATEEQRKEVQEVETGSSTSFLQDIAVVFPPVLLIVIVLGVIYSGAATPTEAAGIGAVGAFLLLLIEKRSELSMSLMKDILVRASRTSGMMLFLIFGGMVLSYVVSYIGIAQEIANAIIGMGLNKYLVMIAIYVLWFILGMVLDPISMVLLTIPFLFPTLVELGFHPLWIGVVSTLTVGIGMITPPIGLNLFVIKGICDVPMQNIIKGVIPFVFVMLICLAILTVFPDIATYLPLTMK